MFRPWRSFPFMVAAGLAVGLLTGGYPEFSREVSQAALVAAMAFSMTEFSFEGVSLRAEFRGFLLSLTMSYVVLTGLLVIFGLLSPEGPIRNGWILMAAVPPAVAVVPITGVLKGDTRRALISAALLYLAGILVLPAITLAVVGQSVPIDALVLQTLLLIGLPILASRPLRSLPRLEEIRPTAVPVSFFVLIVAIAGSTRPFLFGSPELAVSLSLLSVLRTFGLGLAVLGVSRLLRMNPGDQIAATTFVSFKNLGLAVVLAFSFFGPQATLPSIVSLVFEILWLGALPFLFLRSQVAPSSGLEEERGEG